MFPTSSFRAALCVGFALAVRLSAAERPAVLPAPPGGGGEVPPDLMRRVYDEVKTPFKFGVVIRGEAGESVDCPNVFWCGGRWYMMYVAIRNREGYQTYIARSADLLHWEKLGCVLSFRREGWDAWQADGGIALYDTRWDGGTHSLGQFNGRYWLSYIGGARHGYEPDPLAIGLASAADPTLPLEWARIPGNPVLSPAQADARPFERATLYKSAVIRDERETLGWPFVMFYNAKCPPDGREAIGMAVSRDLVGWRRYGADPVVSNEGGSRWAISGDPQIARIGDVWVMFYYGAFWNPKAFDTFACSYDLARWTKWNGPHLIEPSEPYDRQFAHKPWLLKHDGVVYHFYCAVGDQGRVIALATSKGLAAQRPVRP